jgi:hypothetical protein
MDAGASRGAPGVFFLAIQFGSCTPLRIVKTSEESRGKALQRTLLLLRDLMLGAEHNRHTAKKVADLEPAAASRHLEAFFANIPGIVREERDNLRTYRFDPGAVLKPAAALKRPTRLIAAAACFGASLSGIFEGSPYKPAMREALDQLLAKGYRSSFGDITRKFWFVRRGGEVSLLQNWHLLDEVVDALLDQNLIKIKYEHFEGEVDEYSVSPLSM